MPRIRNRLAVHRTGAPSARRRRATCGLAAALLLGLLPASAHAYGSVGSCPADFAALAETAEQVRNPTVRASALELVRRSVAMSVWRAGGLDRFVERQRELIAQWRAFPPDPSFEPDRGAMIALYEGSIEIAGCVQRKGDPRQKVDRQDKANRAFDAVVAVHAQGRDERPASGSGVLIGPCHVLTSQHVVFGTAAPRHGLPAVVLLGEVTQPRADFAERIDAEVVGFSRSFWPDTGVEHDWALLRLARKVDADYPSLPLLPRGADAPDRRAFSAGRRGLTVAGFPGEKLIEGGSVSTLWRHEGCHVMAAESPIGGWATTCAMNPGQSGGPVLADEGGNRWQLIGLATAMSSANRGVVPADETDATRANLVTPLVGETLEEIYQLIDTYSCRQ